jgi:hypothetical protein
VFRRHLSNAGFLGVLTGFLQYFDHGPTPNDVLAPTLRGYLGAFQNLCHGRASLIHFHLVTVNILYSTVDDEATPFYVDSVMSGA